MTLIAWQYSTTLKSVRLAADRKISVGNVFREGGKLFRHGNVVHAWTGPSDFGLALMQWRIDGGNPTNFPTCNSGQDFAVLVEASTRGVELFCQSPFGILITEPFWALGAGAEFALGAFSAGATLEAVMQLTEQRVASCGLGFDVEVLE